VKDSKLKAILREYLLTHPDICSYDSTGKLVLLSKEEIEEYYGDALVGTKNLKNDSFITDKRNIGIYMFKFSSLSERPHLYIQYPDRIEFIEIESKDFNFEKALKKIIKLIHKYPDKFNQKERIKTLEGVMNVIYTYKYVDLGY